MTTEYDHRNPTSATRADCDAAVGKRATVTYTGTVVSARTHPAGSYVMFQPDEKFGFGAVSIGCDLELVSIYGMKENNTPPIFGHIDSYLIAKGWTIDTDPEDLTEAVDLVHVYVAPDGRRMGWASAISVQASAEARDVPTSEVELPGSW